jgi:diguanylate cyclase (GGDEF)-like protein
MNGRLGEIARYRRRSLLALGAIAAAALSLALAAILDLTGADVAIDGCLALALLGAVSYAFAESGFSQRFSGAAFVSGQMAAAFLLLAWLTFRAGDTQLPIPLLYLIAMVYGTLLLERARLASLAAFALVSHGTALFMLIDHGSRLRLPAAWLQLAVLLLAFAWLITAAGLVLRLRARLAEAHSRLHDLELAANERASRDTLTGVYHHRHLMEALEREIARAERIGKPLSIARADLDWLGSVNEAHGHAAGDIALRRFTVAATDALRDVDVFGRYGGKEFLAILPDTDLKGAVIAAERLRAAVGREPVPEVRGRRHLSCTLGVAEHRKGENTRLVIGRAEAGLNYAKAAGRDRVAALGADGKPMLIESA